MQWPDAELEGPADAAAELISPGFSMPGVSTAISAAAELPCRDDPDLFFAEEPEEVELAKSLCGDCAFRAACLAGALARREPWGVWGGELFLRGQVIPHKRPRGRPRKDQVAA